MRPLSGLRVLAFEQYGAGPFGTQYLADLGAEVIKVEQPGTGDYLRALGPYFVGGEQIDSASSLFFQALNRNKKSLTLDLTAPEGKAVLHRLVASADATADNLRGDVPEKLGLTYDHLKGANAGIVCAHCSAYGRDWSKNVLARLRLSDASGNRLFRALRRAGGGPRALRSVDRRLYGRSVHGAGSGQRGDERQGELASAAISTSICSIQPCST